MPLQLATISLHKYLQCTKEWIIKPVHIHKIAKSLYSVSKEAVKFVSEIDLNDINVPKCKWTDHREGKNIEIKSKTKKPEKDQEKREEIYSL